MQQLKTCTKCEEEKEIDCFPFQIDKKANKTYVRNQCKECFNAYWRGKFRKRNKIKQKEYHQKWLNTLTKEQKLYIKQYLLVYQKKYRAKLSTPYLKSLLLKLDWPKDRITPALIEYKRVDIQLYRELKH